MGLRGANMQKPPPCETNKTQGGGLFKRSVVDYFQFSFWTNKPSIVTISSFGMGSVTKRSG